MPMSDTVQPARTTPLHDVHRELGASFTSFAGWAMPSRYSSELAEHHAVRNGAGLFDLSHMGELEVSGPDAGRALDYALVGRPSTIAVGRARYSMMCAEDGGVIDDLVVYRFNEQRYLLVANASNSIEVATEMEQRSERYTASVADTTHDWALIAIQGPSSQAVLESIAHTDLTGLKYYAIRRGRIDDHDVLLARTGYTGEDGFEIYCRPGSAEALWTLLHQADKGDAVTAAGLACRDTLRLEAGMALYGNELTRSITPFEANLSRLIHFDKLDGFVGDNALLELKDRDPKTTLVGLVPAGRRSPRNGYPVVDPQSGTEVGVITSGSPSPTMGHPIAMAYVPPYLAEPDTRLDVSVRGSLEESRVVPLPFYTRAR